MIVKRKLYYGTDKRCCHPDPHPLRFFFPKSHRRLADFILENLHEVAFLSINELSQRTGISPATITRFARRLDFQGYPDLQRGLYEHQKQWAPFGQLKSLLRRETPAEDAGPDSLQWTIQNNIGLLEALYTPPAAGFLCPRPGDPASRPTIYIAGMRSSYATAYYLAFMLQQMCDNVHLLTTSTSDLPTALSDVHPRTACWSSPMPGTPAPPMTSYPTSTGRAARSSL